MPFTELAPELQQMVMRNCSTNDLLNLSRTSRLVHALSIPVLYRTVDLSNRNTQGIHPPSDYLPLGYPPPDYPPLVTPDNPLRQRSQPFILTLLAHPEYGKYVKSFTWTYAKRRGRDVDIIGERRVWEALRAMGNVEMINLASLAIDYEIDLPPPLLLSSVRSVRLVGQMSSTLARSILYSVDPSKLTSLELDNLIDFGHGSIDENLYPLAGIGHRTSKLGYLGPMRGHLRHLEGRCTSLTRLRLRDVEVHGFGPDWSSSNEERCGEWASFINSVKRTLRDLTLEQGLELRGGFRCGIQRDRVAESTGRSMDTRFIKYILPTLAGGPWPNLKEMTIRRVGVRTRYSSGGANDLGSFGAAIAQLGIALGPEVQLTFKTNST